MQGIDVRTEMIEKTLALFGRRNRGLFRTIEDLSQSCDLCRSQEARGEVRAMLERHFKELLRRQDLLNAQIQAALAGAAEMRGGAGFEQAVRRMADRFLATYSNRGRLKLRMKEVKGAPRFAFELRLKSGDPWTVREGPPPGGWPATGRLGHMGADPALVALEEALYTAADRIPEIDARLKLLELALTRVAAMDVEQEKVEAAAYKYIPIDLAWFFDCIDRLVEKLAADADYAHPDFLHRPCSFLEVGAGSGRNAFLLRVSDRYGFHSVQGFDISERLVELGQRVFGLGDDLFVGDCRAVDYAPYDIVYFYRPFAEPVAQAGFEELLVGSMRKGAYLVGCRDEALDADRRLMRVDDTLPIWKKTLDG